MNPAWVGAIAALAGVVLTVLAWLTRLLVRGFKKVDRFLEDWDGVPADEGHAGRPGVMARLIALEHGLSDVQTQVHVDSGQSLKDAVVRTETAVADIQRKLDTGKN